MKFTHLSVALLFFACSCQAAGDVLIGRVVGLSDGDTLTVLDAHFREHRIRLAGIDAPERRQPFSNRAKLTLATLVMGRHVSVHWNKADRYGRLVGVVRSGEQDAGLEQLKAGLAWHYKAYAREQSAEDRQLYADAEEEARRTRRGLWSQVQPEPPWEFRRSRRDRP